MGSASREPSAAARAVGAAVAGSRLLSTSSGESTLNLTITRAVCASSTVETLCAHAGAEPCPRTAAIMSDAGTRLEVFTLDKQDAARRAPSP